MQVEIKLSEQGNDFDYLIFSGNTSDENFDFEKNAAMFKAAASVGIEKPDYWRYFPEKDYTRVDFGSWKYFLKIYEEKESTDENSFQDSQEKTKELSEKSKTYFKEATLFNLANTGMTFQKISASSFSYNEELSQKYLELLDFLYKLQEDDALKEKIKNNIFLQEKYDTALMYLEDAIANLAFLLII